MIETSPDITEIAKALPLAQAAFAPIKKDAANPHFSSKYASLSELTEAVLPALHANGISLHQAVDFEGGSAKVTTRLQHSSTQFFQTTHSVPVSRADAQGIGSALTYARRQALQAFLGLAPAGEDDDGEGSVGRGAGRPPLPPSEPARPGLPDRVARLEKTMMDVKTVRDLTRARDNSKDLRAELAKANPDEAARIEALHEARHAALIGGEG